MYYTRKHLWIVWGPVVFIAISTALSAPEHQRSILQFFFHVVLVVLLCSPIWGGVLCFLGYHRDWWIKEGVVHSQTCFYFIPLKSWSESLASYRCVRLKPLVTWRSHDMLESGNLKAFRVSKQGGHSDEWSLILEHSNTKRRIPLFESMHWDRIDMVWKAYAEALDLPRMDTKGRIVEDT